MKLEKIDSVSPTQLFPVTSGALRVTDPCYDDLDCWCAGTLKNVKNGVWAAQVGRRKCEADMRSMREWLRRCEDNAKSSIPELAQYNEGRVKEIQESLDAYDGRVAYLHITHTDVQSRFDHEAELDATWEDSGIEVGVDSGQAGFFDQALFADLHCVHFGTTLKDSFYREACRLTGESEQWGVCALGAVSSTGYGDGVYTCWVRRVDGQVVEAIIVYLAQYEDEDEDEEDDSGE